MATVNDIVSRSLRLLKAIDAHENSVSGPAMANAIVALNAMMIRWEADGLALGWADVSGPGDTMPTDRIADKGITYNLAVELAPEYDGVGPDVASVAMAEYAALLRDAVSNSVEPTALDQLPGGSTAFDINSGYS